MAKMSARRKATVRKATVRKAPARKATAPKSAPRKTRARKTAGQKPTRRQGPHYWSGRVTRQSDALDLEGGVFKGHDPGRIALSLKRSAERSRRRKSDPYRSAMSMLNLYVNRAGKTLPAARRRTLQKAKDELRRVFGRE